MMAGGRLREQLLECVRYCVLSYWALPVGMSFQVYLLALDSIIFPSASMQRAGAWQNTALAALVPVGGIAAQLAVAPWLQHHRLVRHVVRLGAPVLAALAWAALLAAAAAARDSAASAWWYAALQLAAAAALVLALNGVLLANLHYMFRHCHRDKVASLNLWRGAMMVAGGIMGHLLALSSGSSAWLVAGAVPCVALLLVYPLLLVLRWRALEWTQFNDDQVTDKVIVSRVFLTVFTLALMLTPAQFVASSFFRSFFPGSAGQLNTGAVSFLFGDLATLFTALVLLLWTSCGSVYASTMNIIWALLTACGVLMCFFFVTAIIDTTYWVALMLIAFNGVPNAVFVILPYIMLSFVVNQRAVGRYLAWMNMTLLLGQLLSYALVVVLQQTITDMFDASCYALGTAGAWAVLAVICSFQLRWRRRLESSPDHLTFQRAAPVFVLDGSESDIGSDLDDLLGTQNQQKAPTVEERKRRRHIQRERRRLRRSMPMHRKYSDRVPVVTAADRRSQEDLFSDVANKYFIGRWRVDKQHRKVAVVVPFYNEEASELFDTLQNLAVCSQLQLKDQMVPHMALHVLLVMDGWKQASKSMKRYMDHLFYDGGEAAGGEHDVLHLKSSWSQELERHEHLSKVVEQIMERPQKFVDSPVLEEIKNDVTPELLALFDDDPDLDNYPDDVVCDIVKHVKAWKRKNSESLTWVLEHLNDNGVCDKLQVAMPPVREEAPVMGDKGLLQTGGVSRVLQIAAQSDLRLTMSLLVKRDNRRKHNSHEWFFHKDAGFCAHHRPSYAFATDCSTLYEPNCLKMLVDYMDLHDDASACTGRQRVKTVRMQGSEGGLVDWYFRSCQRYDFESSFACFMGAFALVGFLPVIPGPCGIYRWKVMQGRPPDAGDPASCGEGPSEWYFDVVNKDPSETGLVLGNLKIAEDRVLSASAVLKSQERCHMGLVPDAVFYFDAELSLENLIAQRRRWINGTAAGYIYFALIHVSMLWTSNAALHIKLGTFLLLFCQLLVYAVVAITPSIFLCALRLCLYFWFPSPRYNQAWPTAIWLAYVALYIIFIVVHVEKKFVAWLFHLMHFTGVISIINSILVSIFYMVYSNFQVTLANLVVWVVFGVMLAPLAIAAVSDWVSLGLMIQSIIPFYMFVPTLVAWFGAYSFCRVWDMTWGNRPNANATEVDESRKKYKTQSYSVTVVIVLVNLMFVFLFMELATSTCINDATEQGSESQDSAQLLSCQVVSASYLVGTVLAVFAFAMFQIVLSIIYFVFINLPEKGNHYLWKLLLCRPCSDPDDFERRLPSSDIPIPEVNEVLAERDALATGMVVECGGQVAIGGGGLPGDSDSSDGEADDIANLRAYATVSMHEETDPLISDKEKPSFGTL